MARHPIRNVSSKNPFLRPMAEALIKFSRSQTLQKTFEMFIEMWALELASFLPTTTEQQRQRYKDLMSGLNQTEKDNALILSNMLMDALTYEVKTKGPKDVLGFLYEQLDLHSTANNQFFTPGDVSELMARLVTPDTAEETEAIQKALKEVGYVSCLDPAVGSGRLLYDFASSISEIHHINYQKDLYLEAVDVDIRCVWMTYIQLTLYGIAARVFHGNTLTMQTWSVWKTPTYILGGWESRINAQRGESAC